MSFRSDIPYVLKTLKEFLVPYDASSHPTPFELISMNNLSKWFKYIKSRHVLLLLDCCFSGLSVLRNRPIECKIITPNALRRHLDSSSRIIINAGTREDAVSDGGWNDNSVFTGALISSPTLDNIGSVINLYYYLLTTVPRFSDQTPSIGKWKGYGYRCTNYNKDRFIFILMARKSIKKIILAIKGWVKYLVKI